MFFIESLKRSVEADDEVARSFIEVLVPQLFNNYVAMSAKGGDHRGDSSLNEQQQRGFEANADQSMCTHLLNGIFPSLRLMRLLEMEGIERFSDVERRVYILSYLMHDIDKIERRTVETKTREDIEHSKAMIAKVLLECHAEAFLPTVDEYLEDITWLVVNTQQRWGTHLSTYMWHFRLPERSVLSLRRFCTYSDQIAYAVASPAEIMDAGDLATILTDVSRNRFTFSYHQLREVRGLITNVMNNAIVDLFTDEGRREGMWPYLFFANGVVYITRKTLQLEITAERITRAVKEQLQHVCGGHIKKDAPGFKFSIQGIAKHPEYYFEFLTIEDYMELLASSTLDRTRNDISGTPLEKLRQMQANGEIDAPLPSDVTPDLRISMVSRFFSVLFATMLGPDMLDKKQDALRKQAEQEVVASLGLQPYWDTAKTIPNKGGVEYRWFWLGAWYLHDHPGITAYEGKGNLHAVFREVFDVLLQRVGAELRTSIQGRQMYLNHLDSYLEAIVELPMSVQGSHALPDFYAELEGYASAKGKSKGRKLICTLCNSAYPTEEHSDNAVLFQPWVYKNKLPLYAGKNAGGMCAICALELMLRQLLQKGALRLTGSKFEAMKSKYIAVYPNYFFTTETGQMVQDILDQLRTMNFFSLRRQLTGRTLTVRDVLQSEMFEPASVPTQPFVRPPDNLEDDDTNDAEEDAAEAEVAEHAEGSGSDASKERSYLKYDYHGYPGMCFFGMRAGKDDNDTASWAMPALLALALPLVTGAKVVISELLLPLFSSGHDFQETVVFDAPHPYLSRLLDTNNGQVHRNRVRVNQVLSKLSLLTQVYQVNLETYAKGPKPEWKHLLGIVRDMETDPLYIFSYLRTQNRISSYYASNIEAYIGLYKRVCTELLERDIRETMLDMKEDDLGNIQQCVDRYVMFYRGGFETHSILKPIDIVAKAIINSPLEIDDEDLLWQIQGEIQSWLDRVRAHQAAGRALCWGKDIPAKEEPAVREFVTYFYQQVFKTYCQGERGELRSRLNRFKDGCEAYYVHLMQRLREPVEPEPEKEPVA